MIYLRDWHGEEYPLNICTVTPSPAYHYYKHDLFFLIDTLSVNDGLLILNTFSMSLLLLELCASKTKQRSTSNPLFLILKA